MFTEPASLTTARHEIGMKPFVQLDPANSDYAAIMAFVEAGELVIADAE